MKNFKIVYNSERDSFEIWSCTGRNGEWGLNVASKCQVVGDDKEANFIHFSILKEVQNLLSLGYKYVY